MRLAIIGAGRIGLAINDLLEDDFDIKLCDSRVAAETYGVNLPIVDFIDASDIKMLGSFIDYSDVVISAVNYKFNRDMFLTFKCLAGDTGDNIPGIKGIGPKRAELLFDQYGDLFDIYHSCPIDSKYKFIHELNENADRLLLNAELMDIESYSEKAIIESNMDLEDLYSINR